MIDIHSHILPGLDDGSQHLDQSIEMAKAAVAEGIHTVIATPHHHNGKYQNEAQHVSESVNRLNQVLQENQIPLSVLGGQEIRVYPHLLEDAYEGLLMPLHGSNYFLIEFPSNKIPKDTDTLFYELKVMGITPIIAHPERNQVIVSNPERLLELIELGALSQVTSHSINGMFGTKIQSFSLSLCKQNLVHFIASDAHNLRWRPFNLLQAYQNIEQELGFEYVDYYMGNAQYVVEQRIVEAWEPLIMQKKWYRFWEYLA